MCVTQNWDGYAKSWFPPLLEKYYKLESMKRHILKTHPSIDSNIGTTYVSTPEDWLNK